MTQSTPNQILRNPSLMVRYSLAMFSTVVGNLHYFVLPLRIHWRLLTVLKTSNKSVWSNVFWYVIVCVFCKCIQYMIYWDKTKMVKRFPLDKITSIQKLPSYFFHELQLITVIFLICDFYMGWSTRFVSLKMCVGFSIFDSVLFLLKFIFLLNKMHGVFHFKTS